MEQRRSGLFAWFDRHQVVKILVYYAALAGVVGVLYQIRPTLQGVFSTEQFQRTVTELRQGDPLADATSTINLTPFDLAVDSVVMMFGGVLLMLPVAWVHILTRSRKGFSQSMVQTLIFLPVVVAGVLMLVQHNVALAFGLGGVVGAVSFRNRLADPKDAIYIFVAIAVGLAAGVQVLSVAAAISMFFNLVVLCAWRFDFGRMPAELEASIAEGRLDKLRPARAMPADWMKLLDKQVMQSMTPEMLNQLSRQAADRARKVGVALGVEGAAGAGEEKKPRFDSLLRLTLHPDDVPPVRQQVEEVLEGQTKRWEFEKSGTGDSGRVTVHYKVKFKKSIPSNLVVEAIRRSVLPKAVTIDVRDA